MTTVNIAAFTVSLWGNESVRLEVNDGVLSIDGVSVPGSTFERVVQKGATELIRDGGACPAGTSVEIRNAQARKKIDSMIAGTLGGHTPGSSRGPRLDVDTRARRDTARAMLIRELARANPSDTSGTIAKMVTMERLTAYMERSDIASALDLIFGEIPTESVEVQLDPIVDESSDAYS